MATYTPSATWHDPVTSIDEDTPLDGDPTPDEVQNRELADNIKWLRNYVESVYGTHLATANAMIRRDGAGRAKVAAPSAADDIARLYEIQQLTQYLDGEINGLSQSTASDLSQAVAAVQQISADALSAHAGAADPHGQYLLETAFTATAILNMLKTVDGAGSGLDADLIGGRDVGSATGQVPYNITTDTGWVDPPTLYNGWEIQDPLKIRRYSNGWVQFRGSIKNGSSGLLLYVPSGFRTSYSLWKSWPIINNSLDGCRFSYVPGSTHYLYMYNTGSTTTEYFYLDNIGYFID